jgi:hypothetical protein
MTDADNEHAGKKNLGSKRLQYIREKLKSGPHSLNSAKKVLGSRRLALVVSSLLHGVEDTSTKNIKRSVAAKEEATTLGVVDGAPMWSQWVKAGQNEQKRVNFINGLKIKHLEDGHNKDTGAGVSEFETEVVEKLNQWCGETSNWNAKKKIVYNFKEAPLWTKVKRAAHASKQTYSCL